LLDREDAYGMHKRLIFAIAAIERLRPAAVLEIGCGTGAFLLNPLAQQFPEIRFIGIDSDDASIAYGNEHYAADNLVFANELPASESNFDFVIASEVLEHVDAPVDFLRFARSKLSARGQVLLTIPNGYGPFEMASFFQWLLEKLRLFEPMRVFKRRLLGHKPLIGHAGGPPMSLANSPHINFFNWREIERIIRVAGLRIDATKNRTFLCGFGLDILVTRLRLTGWNARIADRLPRAWVSDWMLLLSAAPESEPGGEYVPGQWARLRRRWNKAAAARID
jgi:SAM-dependent methyltransferase